ncbi:histidine phosphatase family protein [Pandoraea sp.]|uniref:histidine phosphatase family protein n=1 Tax=Pandoraea sp. TaxID=1883445 RepID=UPI00121C10E4|nr:histidine phosphatase family protein [Pandoraea sp.]TAL55189.1 MAG: histidine phosphatase family protein [Pandoraea sp.]TAM18845.1 MAG: histidine phosphatase family protein [Pandoraea sp.]
MTNTPLTNPGAPLSADAYAPPKRRRIYLMRHGAVTYFDDSGKPIVPESVPLNAAGRAQARAAGELFATQAIRFDRVIVSGLPRTIETAQHVLAEIGQDIALESWPEWQEIRGGRLSEIAPQDIHAAFVGAFDGVASEDRRFLGGETVGQLLDRILPSIAKLRSDPGWDTVLLVLHGGVNRAILSHAIHPTQRLFIGQLAQAAGCINALDVGDAPHDWVVRMLNFSPPAPLHREMRQTIMETMFQEYLRHRTR